MSNNKFHYSNKNISAENLLIHKTGLRNKKHGKTNPTSVYVPLDTHSSAFCCITLAKLHRHTPLSNTSIKVSAVMSISKIQDTRFIQINVTLMMSLLFFVFLA
jgi:hypothetical protein